MIERKDVLIAVLGQINGITEKRRNELCIIAYCLTEAIQTPLKNTLKFRFVRKKRLYNTLALNYYF